MIELTKEEVALILCQMSYHDTPITCSDSKARNYFINHCPQYEGNKCIANNLCDSMDKGEATLLGNKLLKYISE